MLLTLLRRHLPHYTLQAGIVLVLLLVQSIANLYLPNLNAEIINNGVATGDTAYIVRTGSLMLAVTLVLALVAVATAYMASRVAQGVGRDLRGSLFTRVLSFSAREMDHFGTPSLITRNTNDVQQIQMFLQIGLMLLVSAPIMAIGGVIMALHEDVHLSLLLVVIVPLMGAVVAVLLSQAVPLFRVMQVRLDRVTQVLREQIMGVRVIRAFVRVEPEAERFERANADLTGTALHVNRIFAAAFPMLMGIMNLSTVAVLYFGGRLVDSGDMPIGNLTAFLMYIMQILMAVLMAVGMVIFVPRAEASAERIADVLDTVPAVTDPARPREPTGATGAVTFRDVTFGYPHGDRPVLQDVTFELRPGETMAVIGGTGSGKSTLVKLVTRAFDVSGGVLEVDGLDVREQSRERLWSRLGLVPQQAYLFQGTVADNLRFGRADASEAELWHALEVAQASDFVAAMPGALDAPIDQGGTNVSGGQRQRLAIARALVKRPDIYLFDDCFSALDATTDARLRAALRADTAGAAVLIVAQRVSTILPADRIVVLDEGRIVGLGPHAELMRTCEPYREIVESQLGEAAAA
ncbi:MAG: ABC transporter ATP-binding protein/permease [Chloroflexi bacterium]|nr:ABC transporter ATP-binding protein/permease [Chloroflexota bacterium]